MVRIRYLGHSAFQLFGSKGTMLIDPYLRGNPKATILPDSVEADVILVTHAHDDHLGDAVEIAKRLGPGKRVVTVIADTWDRYTSVDRPGSMDFII